MKRHIDFVDLIWTLETLLNLYIYHAITLYTQLQLLTLFVFPGYIVEACAEDEEDFTVLLSTNGYETKAILRELRTDTRYQFQIKAVNKAGAGEESEATDFVLIQDDRGNNVHLRYGYNVNARYIIFIYRDVPR